MTPTTTIRSTIVSTVRINPRFCVFSNFSKHFQVFSKYGVKFYFIKILELLMNQQVFSSSYQMAAVLVSLNNHFSVTSD